MNESRGSSNLNQNRWIAIGLIAAALIGMMFYGKQYFPMSQSIQKQYTVTGNGVNLQNAFDSNLDTYWEGDAGRYGKYYYTIIDLGELMDIDKVKITVGGSGSPINYMINIQSSTNGNIWMDVIGASETGYFTEKTQYDYNFLKHKARYVKIGVKLQGLQTQKMRVYDIKVNQ